MKKEIDHISSTDVITSTLKSCNQKQLNAMLKHNCIGDMRKSNILRVDDQTLRFMRHKEGSQLYKGEILYCNQCNKKWNSNEINLLFIEHHFKKQLLQNKIDYYDYFGALYEKSDNTFESKPSNYTMNKINTILLRNRVDMLELEEQSNSISLHICPIVNYSKNIHATYHH